MTGINLGLRLLGRYWWAIPLIVAALCIVALKVEIRSQERRIAGLETRLADARRDLLQCRANTAALDGAIARQNAAIAEARRQSDARTAELERAGETARRAAQAADARARLILARRSTGDACADARALILESVR